MPRLMTMPAVEFVPAGTPGAQRVAVMDSPGHLTIMHATVPTPGPYELRVKVLYNGICGSDLEVMMVLLMNATMVR